MQDEHVLVDILSTLHRLEARFDDQSDRLSVIERSVSPDPDPPLRRSTSTRTWAASERASIEKMTAEYKTSVANIRNRFEFIDDSSPSVSGVWVDKTEKDADGQSVSVYSEPERPESRMRLDLVPPPRNGNREKPAKMHIIALRYEDMVESPAAISSQADSATASPFTSFSGTSTPASSPGYAGTVTFDEMLDNISNNGGSRSNIPAIQIHIKESILQHFEKLRSTSHVWAEKAMHGLYAAADPVPDRVVKSLKQTAGRFSKPCSKAFQRAIACTGRKMVDQQLKRLDVAA